jgi:hypothetical protein
MNSDGNENLLFFAYNYDEGYFARDEDLSSKFQSFSFNKEKYITNLIACDINGDNELDLIVTTKNEKDFSTTEFYIFSTSLQKFNLSDFKIVDSGVIAGDFNGDMR